MANLKGIEQIVGAKRPNQNSLPAARETPRTDAVNKQCRKEEGNDYWPWKMRDHAEQLERELIEMTKRYIETENKLSPFVAGVQWNAVADVLPDDEMSVLVALKCGEVWTAYLEAGEWRYQSNDKIGEEVTHWAEYPEPPKV